MTTATAPATTATAPKTLGAFRGGTQPTTQATGYAKTVTLSSEIQELDDLEIAPANILRCIYLEVTATAAGNAATVAFAPDAPLNVLSSVNFHDSGGSAIVGSFGTHALSMAMKYFGLSRMGDPRANAVYSEVSGAGATGGSFNIVFRVPVEAVARTGIGSLRDTSTQTPFVLSLTVNTLANIYTTAPTTAPTVSVRVRLGGYWKGPDPSFAPAPVAFGTTQYINRASIQGLNGASDFQVPNIGFGNPWRNLMWLNYETGGARSDTAFPDPLQITYRGNNLVQYSQNLWKSDMSEAFALDDQTQDTPKGLDTGVYVLPFDRDFGLIPGAELGLGYLMTSEGDAFRLNGEWNDSSTLYHIVNYLAVKGSPNSIRAGA